MIDLRTLMEKLKLHDMENYTPQNPIEANDLEHNEISKIVDEDNKKNQRLLDMKRASFGVKG